MTAFHQIATICSICLTVITFLLTFAHLMPTEDDKLAADGSKVVSNKNRNARIAKLICKIGNVTVTVMAFLQIFYSDLHFDIGEDIDDYLGKDN